MLYEYYLENLIDVSFEKIGEVVNYEIDLGKFYIPRRVIRRGSCAMMEFRSERLRFMKGKELLGGLRRDFRLSGLMRLVWAFEVNKQGFGWLKKRADC